LAMRYYAEWLALFGEPIVETFLRRDYTKSHVMKNAAHHGVDDVALRSHPPNDPTCERCAWQRNKQGGRQARRYRHTCRACYVALAKPADLVQVFHFRVVLSMDVASEDSIVQRRASRPRTTRSCTAGTQTFQRRGLLSPSWDSRERTMRKSSSTSW
jgi:2-hydroxychromene-2-carboxylate isomerase